MKRKAVVPPVPLNRKMVVPGDASGGYLPRVTHRAAHKKTSARFKISCGCCPESFEIYYDDDLGDAQATLEIGGVNAGVGDWRRILLPLLGFKQQGKSWVDNQQRSR